MVIGYATSAQNEPKFHLVILTARNNPLATSDREVRKDTVLLVFVPRVRLQTLALGHFIVQMHAFDIEFAGGKNRQVTFE